MWKKIYLATLFLAGCETVENSPQKSGAQTLSELSTTTAQISASEITKDDIRSVAQGSQALGIDLFKEIRKADDGNVFISPVSISSAFGLAYAGSAGQTEVEMAEVLNFELPNNRIHRALGQLQATVEDETKGQLFDTANTIFVEKTAGLTPAYKALISDNYEAGPQSVDFMFAPGEAIKTINKWVSDQTRGLIKKTVDEKSVHSGTRSVMVNTAYLKADWLSPFKASKTEDGDFFAPEEIKTVPLMFQRHRYKLMSARGFRAIELPYQNSTMSAVVFLPKSKTGLDDFERKLTSTKLSKWIEDLNEEKIIDVDLTLPKVDLKYQSSGFDELLKALGMTTAFSDFAQFPGRLTDTQRTKLDKVIHKTVLKVDEDGTEAAAVTAITEITVSGTRYLKDAEVFRVDHPFFLVLKNNETDAVLFMGRIVDPMPDYKAPGIENP